jgi:shikimate dehydrogenase
MSVLPLQVRPVIKVQKSAQNPKLRKVANMAKNDSSPDRYAVIGHPIAHSRSPLIHTLFARQTHQNLTYELIDAEPKDFETAVRGFAAAGGKGVNVTVPHKEAAFALVDEVSDPAKAAGAVNTISFLAGKLRGDNTDGVGLIRDLTVNERVTLAGRRVLVLGAGGAARGIVGPLLASKPAELVVANRTKSRADDLAAQFHSPASVGTAAFDELAKLAPFDVLLNATSAGLRGEATAFPGSLVGPASVCYDLVYSSKDTPFVTWARENGAARALQGWGMLIEQAAEAFFIWRGVRPDTRPLRQQLAH